jgi:nucleotide-binding universal stress UspA family protein
MGDGGARSAAKADGIGDSAVGARRCIVVGVDGSATSQEALLWALGLGGALGAEVVAVHAVGLREGIHDRGTTPDEWRAALRDRVENTWCAPMRAGSCPSRVELRDGNAVEVVLRVAEDVHADLIVVGSRGVGDTPARALGSTSLRVLQASPLPTLVVPDRGTGRSPAPSIRLRRVLVGVDRSEPSLTALHLAADVVQLLGGSLSVLEVIEYVPPFPLGPSTAVTSAGEEEAPARAMALLESAVATVRRRGVAVQVIVRSGEPALTLLEVADELDVDLVVVGTRGRGGPSELLLGSVARTVADGVRRPTLVVPAAVGSRVALMDRPAEA